MSGRIAVAMSGGVDSSVAALLLKRQGKPLVGVFMHNWDEQNEQGQCSSEADYHEVEEVCSHIGIPCKRVEFIKEYWHEVFSEFLSDYQLGHTPNPDILCNEKIKFGVFHRYCTESLGAVAIATGHYARVEHTATGVRLLQAVDKFKDQTYFLSRVSQVMLQQSLFPIGHLMKDVVKELAMEAGLFKAARRKESMGVCFIGKRKFSEFLKQYIEEKPGYFVSLDGRTIGSHKGHHFFTIGQRARIGGQVKPWFVAGRDSHGNTVTVVEGSLHPALFTLSFTTATPHWIAQSHDINWPIRCKTRCHHQQVLHDCTVKKEEGCGLVVALDEPMRAVTPGQYAVFYNGEECLGGACIREAGPSLWQQGLITHEPTL